jgi:hypothetical protein
MGTRRIDILIREARRSTGNEDYGSNAGISDSQICSYFNDALSLVERGITNEHGGQFKKEVFIDLVANQEKYDLPVDFLPSGGILSVEYANGNPASVDPNWCPLVEVTDLERNRGARSIPYAYQVVNSQLWLTERPQTDKVGALRVVYIKRLSRFDIRRGKVDVATLTTSPNEISALEVTLGTVPSPNEYNYNESCCAVDADGVILMKNIKIDGILNESTGAIPVRPDFRYTTGETLPVNSYLVFGQNASTHQLDLGEEFEGFLKAYAEWKIQLEDSNSDSSQKMQEFQLTAASLLDAYKRPNKNIILVPEMG